MLAATRVPRHALAQDVYNCPDFPSQAAAQAEYRRTFPLDPSRLDRDNDNVTCEDYRDYSGPARDEAPLAEAMGDGVEPPEGGDAVIAPSVPIAPPTPSAPPMLRRPGRAIPPDLAARLDQCTAVAVGRHSIVAVGCPGGEMFTISLADDEQDWEPYARAGRADTRGRR